MFTHSLIILHPRPCLNRESNRVPAASGRLGKDVCYNESGELLLWGPNLWDPRAPRRIHRFDVFGESCGSSTFHPTSLEAILNSEVSALAACLEGSTDLGADVQKMLFAPRKHTLTHPVASQTQHSSWHYQPNATELYWALWCFLLEIACSRAGD